MVALGQVHPSKHYATETLGSGTCSPHLERKKEKLQILHLLRLYIKKLRKIFKFKKVEKKLYSCFFPVTTGSYGELSYIEKKDAVAIDPLLF